MTLHTVHRGSSAVFIHVSVNEVFEFIPLLHGILSLKREPINMDKIYMNIYAIQYMPYMPYMPYSICQKYVLTYYT